MNVSLVENGTKHMLDALPNDGHFDLSRPLSHSKIKIPSIKGNKSKVAIDVSYLNNNGGFAIHQAQIVTRQNCNPNWIRVQDLGIVFNDQGFPWYPKYSRLRDTYPLLLDFIHSDIGGQELYKERLLWLDNTSPYKCSQICLQQSSCDMFYHMSDINKCVLFPHISLKDKIWSQYTFPVAPQWRNFIYILQCSLSSENALSPDPIFTKNFENWTFDGQELQARRMTFYPKYVNRFETLIPTSVYTIFAEKDLAISTTISEKGLPLGIDNEFLAAFPQVFMILIDSFTF